MHRLSSDAEQAYSQVIKFKSSPRSSAKLSIGSSNTLKKLNVKRKGIDVGKKKMHMRKKAILTAEQRADMNEQSK